MLQKCKGKSPEIAPTPRAQQEATDTGIRSFCEGGPLANRHHCGPRKRLLLRQAGKGRRSSFPGAIFQLALCHAPEHQSPGGDVSGALVFAATAQETPLDHQALVAGTACIPEPPGAMAIGERVLGRLPPPGHCTDSGLKYTLKSYYEGGFCACPGALA